MTKTILVALALTLAACNAQVAPDPPECVASKSSPLLNVLGVPHVCYYAPVSMFLDGSAQCQPDVPEFSVSCSFDSNNVQTSACGPEPVAYTCTCDATTKHYVCG